MFFNEPTGSALIEHYFGRAAPEIVARVTVHKALADLKWATWSMVKHKVSTLNFDFFSMPCGSIGGRDPFNDPRRDIWLASL
jgi:hypothetical protein